MLSEGLVVERTLKSVRWTKSSLAMLRRCFGLRLSAHPLAHIEAICSSVCSDVGVLRVSGLRLKLEFSRQRHMPGYDDKLTIDIKGL
jgi:hypothetical protein